MKNTLIWFFFLFVFASCEEEVNETLQILIQNKTKNSFDVILYPKSEYLKGNLYRKSDEGTGYTDTKFTLPPKIEEYFDWNEVIFKSKDLNIKPHLLTEKVFDSIYINRENEERIIIFTKEGVKGYSENIFSENSTWNFEIVEDELPTNSKVNPQKYHCYKFVISPNSIVNLNTIEE